MVLVRDLPRLLCGRRFRHDLRRLILPGNSPGNYQRVSARRQKGFVAQVQVTEETRNCASLEVAFFRIWIYEVNYDTHVRLSSSRTKSEWHFC